MRCPKCAGYLVAGAVLARGGWQYQQQCINCGWDSIPRIYIKPEKALRNALPGGYQQLSRAG